MSVNSGISEALLSVWDLTQKTQIPGHLGYKEQSQDERRKTCSSEFLRNSIYQTRRDMPLVRDGTG